MADLSVPSAPPMIVTSPTGGDLMQPGGDEDTKPGGPAVFKGGDATDTEIRRTSYVNPEERASMIAQVGMMSGATVDSMMQAEYNVAANKFKKYAKARKVAAVFNRLLSGVMSQQPDNVHRFIALALTVDDLISTAVESHNAELFDVAIEQYGEALEACRYVYGNANDKVGMVLMRMAQAYEAVSQQEQAVGLYEEALGVLEASVGEMHSLAVMVLNQLAALHITMFNFDQAIEPLERALTAIRAGEGATEENEGDILANMGVAKKELEDTTGAISAYEDAVTHYQLSIGNHEKMADVLNNLGELYESTGDDAQVEKAVETYQQALDVRREVLPAGHRSVVDTINHMAMIRYNQEKYAEAFAYCNEAMTLMEETSKGKGLSAEKKVEAQLKHEAGSHDEAFALYQKQLASYRKQLRTMNRSTSRSFLSDRSLMADLSAISISSSREALPEEVEA